LATVKLTERPIMRKADGNGRFMKLMLSRGLLRFLNGLDNGIPKTEQKHAAEKQAY
jgi:hypothetical protein